MDYAFSKIETHFDRFNGNGGKVYDWHKRKHRDVFDRLFDFSLNKAFLSLYDEEQFKDWTEKAKDAALDEVFLKLLPNQYFDKYGNDLDLFECSLENKCYGILYEEVEKKAEEHGYKTKMNQCLNEILQKRFKFNCNLNYPGYTVP